MDIYHVELGIECSGGSDALLNIETEEMEVKLKKSFMNRGKKTEDNRKMDLEGKEIEFETKITCMKMGRDYTLAHYLLFLSFCKH